MALENGTQLPLRSEIGIYNETHPLRSVMLWGPVGAEAVLAEVHPQNISLFYDKMQVPKARKEAHEFTTTLQSKGVDVVLARDELAHLLPTREGITPGHVQDSLISRLHQTNKKYGMPHSSTALAGYEDDLVDLFHQDIERYGEEGAVALNMALSIDPKMPLGNTIYARDQMNVLLGSRVVSRMKEPIRKPEVALFERVYSELFPKHKRITLPDGETFEGGDAYIHNGHVYIGVGVRTSLNATAHIYEQLRPELEESGLRFAIVEDREGRNNQDFMHLDTFSNPIGEQEIAICMDETNRRFVSIFATDSAGRTVLEDTRMNYTQYLERTGDTIVSIPLEEQGNFGCNFLTLNENEIILPMDDNERTTAALLQHQKTIIPVRLYENTRGYGAAHCMTGQLLRRR